MISAIQSKKISIIDLSIEITLSSKRWNYSPRLKSNVQNNCCSFKASYFPITTNSINKNAIFSQSRDAVSFQREYNFTKNELIFHSKDRIIGFRYFIIRITRFSHYILTKYTATSSTSPYFFITINSIERDRISYLSKMQLISKIQDPWTAINEWFINIYIFSISVCKIDLIVKVEDV